jgi:hypothetical protein|tara:strand:- start:22 stop:987 length:966 start_codon:yes stop_codon:yes gene_type:complete
MNTKRNNNKTKITSANLSSSLNKNAQVVFNNTIETIVESENKMRTETNTCLENVSNNKKDQLKLRDFNDLKKEDVITTVQRVVAYKSANDVDIDVSASAEAEDMHYTLSKDEAEKIESKYKDRDSQEYDAITDQLQSALKEDAEENIEVYYHCDHAVDTEIEEISVDQLARRKYAYHSARHLADELIDHSEVDENRKNKVLHDLKLDKDKHAVELVLKDNVKTFVIVKEKNILNEIEDTRQSLSSSLSETLTFHKKLDDIMLELYDEDRSMYDSLKVFFERLDSEFYFELDQHLHIQEIDLIKELRKQFETLKSKSESSNQ